MPSRAVMQNADTTEDKRRYRGLDELLTFMYHIRLLLWIKADMHAKA